MGVLLFCILRRNSLPLHDYGRVELRRRLWPARRFNRVDPFSGNLNNPLSLHKYDYVHGNPINSIDPTGWFTSAFGYAVEDAIANLWLNEHPGYVEGDDVLFGRASRISGFYLAKPDILNFKDWEYNEIKPLTIAGVGHAAAQMSLRKLQFDPLGYRADGAWHDYPTPLTVGTQEIVFKNVQGVLFYTDLVDNIRELVTVASLAAHDSLHKTLPQLERC